MKNKVVVGMTVAVFSLAGVYYLAAKVVPQALVTVTESAPGVTVSLADSHVIGEKILARADGEDKCVVNVFLMDARGRAVPNKTVGLMGMSGIVAVSEVSDNAGKASFEMSSVEEGQYRVRAEVEGVELSGGVTVTFRN